MAYDFFRAIKSLGLSQEWEHYKPVSWTNISRGVVIMFHPEVQLNTVLVLWLLKWQNNKAALSSSFRAVQTPSSQSLQSFGYLILSLSELKYYDFVFEKSTGNSTTVKSKLESQYIAYPSLVLIFKITKGRITEAENPFFILS